jgi:hypothetical protein
MSFPADSNTRNGVLKLEAYQVDIQVFTSEFGKHN